MKHLLAYNNYDTSVWFIENNLNSLWVLPTWYYSYITKSRGTRCFAKLYLLLSLVRAQFKSHVLPSHLCSNQLNIVRTKSPEKITVSIRSYIRCIYFLDNWPGVQYTWILSDRLLIHNKIWSLLNYIHWDKFLIGYKLTVNNCVITFGN